MKQNQITIEGSQLSISAKKAPIFIRLVMILVLTILILIPLAVTFFALTFGNGPHIGIAFSYLLCWGVGFYLLRVTLWNWVGREILTLNSESISYIADYRLFKDGRKELKLLVVHQDDSHKIAAILNLE